MNRRDIIKAAALGAAGLWMGRDAGARALTDTGEHTVDLGLGGGKILCFANRGPSQMLSTVFVSKTGHVAVVDGGHFDDGEFLYGKLKELGGRVDLWFITHPHSDHYGALDTILRRFGGEGISVGKLIFNFPALGWIARNEPKSGELTGKFLQL
ncbi:MAG: MBL fold metallo-hydrolase, partial [Kiritimatiellae bacterium]|nr:MBL fold metallo-hydrolase [Kiritimatiellia bacterium]